jgi:hypothetical protein
VSIKLLLASQAYETPAVIAAFLTEKQNTSDATGNCCSILTADIDNDGETELVAGKRYRGHDGRDPGELDPLVAYWYDFDPERRVWERGEITGESPAGFGLDPKVADVDNDGDLDVVVADRGGLYWFENELLSSPYADRSQLLVYRNQAGDAHPVGTPADMARRRAHILAGMESAMGSLPTSERRVPLDIQVVTEEDMGSYVRRKITFAAEQNDRVPAYFLIPNDARGPLPAMLCLHPTTKIGKGEVAGVGGRQSRQYGRELAERGYLCIVPDYPSFGEYPYDFRVQGSHYASGSMKAIWNNILAIDVLQSLP